MAVLNQTLNQAGAQRIRIVGVVFVHDERVAIIAIESVLGGKPHKAAAILQNRIDSIVGQAIGGGEVGEFEVPPRSMAALSLDILKVAGSRVSSSFAVPGEVGLP